MPTLLIGQWSDSGARDTTTASNGVSIETTANILKLDDGICHLTIHVQITNHTLMDNATGMVVVSLLSQGKVVSSFSCKTEQVPGRGFPWSPATVRWGDSSYQLPNGLSFDQVGFKISNADFSDDSANIITDLIGLATAIVLP